MLGCVAPQNGPNSMENPGCVADAFLEGVEAPKMNARDMFLDPVGVTWKILGDIFRADSPPRTQKPNILELGSPKIKK